MHRHTWRPADDAALREAVTAYDSLDVAMRPRSKWAWIAGATRLAITPSAARGRMRLLEDLGSVTPMAPMARQDDPPWHGPGDVVIVRDHMAGVHVGTLVERDLAAKRCVLANARKIWAWAGAGSCHGLAAHGPLHDGSRVAPIVRRVEMCAVVEIVWCSPEGARQCMSAPEWRP
jgi:hypothetical protein